MPRALSVYGVCVCVSCRGLDWSMGVCIGGTFVPIVRSRYTNSDPAKSVGVRT